MSGSALAGSAGGGANPLHGYGTGLLGCLPHDAAQQSIGDRSFPCGQEIGRSGGQASKKNYRAYKKGLSKKERKRVRSLMHDFRRRPKDLKAENTQALEDLFEKVPVLGQIYHLRWQATAIFDLALDRQEAATRLQEWIADARASGLDWGPFIR